MMEAHPLSSGIPPFWATGWGEDRSGPFVEFTIAEAVQRLRWIPKGTFIMGSPEDEPGRSELEGPQHSVAITAGFWLFDTPCCQELYQAVVGKNPSRFKSDLRPAERVSWEDCQVFIERAAARVQGLELTLPTEAEWEYACRAGSAEATYAGPIKIVGERNAPVLHDIAWYGGNSGFEFDLDDGVSAADWREKQMEFSTCGTRLVATREPNAWGLYDMLGNVLEWCRDGQRDYTEEPQENPLGPVTNPENRVVRGGSWSDSARDVRAAFRLWRPLDYRFNRIGFRCRVQ